MQELNKFTPKRTIPYIIFTAAITTVVSANELLAFTENIAANPLLIILYSAIFYILARILIEEVSNEQNKHI